MFEIEQFFGSQKKDGGIKSPVVHCKLLFSLRSLYPSLHVGMHAPPSLRLDPSLHEAALLTSPVCVQDEKCRVRLSISQERREVFDERHLLIVGSEQESASQVKLPGFKTPRLHLIVVITPSSNPSSHLGLQASPWAIEPPSSHVIALQLAWLMSFGSWQRFCVHKKDEGESTPRLQLSLFSEALYPSPH